MKKVLFVWSGLKIGGSESSLVLLSQYLSKFFRIEILCHQNICEYAIPPDVNVTNAISKKYKSVIITRVIDKILLLKSIYSRAKNADIIISNEFPLLSILSFVVAKLQSKPFIIWNHSCRSEVPLTNNLIVKKIYKHVLKNADAIVNVSNYAQYSLFDYVACNLSNSQVIYNIVEFRTLHSSDKQRSKNKFTIIAIGSLVAEKNFGLLIRAVEILVKNYVLALEVNICGDGPEKDNLAKLIDHLNLKEVIRLSGQINNPLDYIQNSDLLVSSSNSESFSLVVCEALIMNKPVIVTNTGAAEIIDYGKYGIVIDKNNVEQLVEAINRVINNPLLVKDMISGYDEALSRFNSDKIVMSWRSLFKAMVID